MKKGFRKLRIPCILLSLVMVLTFVARMIQGTLADAESIVTTGSISGLLWIDDDNQPETDGDGVYNGNEQPLAGYTVYLHPADDLTKVITVTQTDADGIYMFEKTEPGSYVLGLIAGTVNGVEYHLPAAVTEDSQFETDHNDPLMAYTEVIELEAEQNVQNINAGMRLVMEENEVIEEPDESGESVISEEPDESGESVNEESSDTVNEVPALIENPDSAAISGPVAGLATVKNNPLQASTRGTSYTIDVNDYYGDLLATGRGYSFNSNSGMLSFNTSAAGNSYTILRSQAAAGSVRGIEFVKGGSPASVSINGISNLTKGLTLPVDFSADLAFNRYNNSDVKLGTELVLPTGYRAKLEINGLEVPTLTFPSDYDLPIVFNGITVSNTINYPAGYNAPITIAGRLFDVKGSQFPAGYSGPVTIGGGAGFTGLHTICRPGTSLSSGTHGIFLPNNILTITMNNATTENNGKLDLLLGATDNFALFLAGSSDIGGYIRVPANASLTIDSADHPNTGSESGRLAIKTSGQNACIGGDATENSGPILIQGGTVEATQSAPASVYYLPAAIGSGASKTGNVTITGGKVVALGNSEGAAIGGGTHDGGISYVTITGGTVTATAGFNGAGIGGGSGANGSKVLITGGTVVANGGDLHNILLGSTDAYGAGIGGGKSGWADVTITGGHVTANSGHGAGIGSGSTSNGDVKGHITITGGTIRGYTQIGANIGKGHFNGYIPTYRIDKDADILMYGRGLTDMYPGVECSGKNEGNGYFVSVLNFKEQIRGDVYVYDADTSALTKVLPIPHNEVIYMSFLFSTGHDYQEKFNIYTEYYNYKGENKGMRQYVHHYDHWSVSPASFHNVKDPVIPSIRDMKPDSYPHNFDTSFTNALIVCFGEDHNGNGDDGPVFYRITEKYVDINGNPIHNNNGQESNTVIVPEHGSYTGKQESITGYIYKGYKWDTPPSGGNHTPGEPGIADVTGDKIVYYVYAVEPGKVDVTVSKIVTGKFINKSKDFTFTVHFKDADGQTLAGTFAYTGQTIPGMGAAVPNDGILTLDKDGKDTFTLKHGQAITILGVPADVQIKIEEAVDPNYDPSYNDSAGGGGKNDMDFNVVETERRFDFFNAQKVDPVPAGVVDDLRGTVAIPVTVALLVLSGWVAIEFIKKRIAMTL